MLRLIFSQVLCLTFVLLSSSRGEVRVLFSSDKEDVTNRWDLYTMLPDGSDLRRITATTSRSEWAAALAPDGNAIAYVDNLGGVGNLWLTDLSGGEAVNVPITNRAMAVQWADEDTLYYFADIAGGSLQRFQIWEVNLDGSGQSQVYGATYDIFPTGSDSFQFHRPSGRLYFTARIPINNPSVLYSGFPSATTFDTTYARCTDPTFGGADLMDDHYDVALSPDGSTLAYAADFFDGNHRMYVRDVNGDCATHRRVSTGFTGDPDWAPDSEWFAFTRATASSFGSGPYIGNIYTVNADGTGLQVRTSALTRVSGRCAHPLVYDSGVVLEELPFVITRIVTRPNLSIAWNGRAGVAYRVQFSSDLSVWRNLPGSLTTAALTGEVVYNGSPVAQQVTERYFRVIEE